MSGSPALVVELGLPSAPRVIRLSGTAIAHWRDRKKTIPFAASPGPVTELLQGDLVDLRRSSAGALLRDWSVTGAGLQRFLYAGDSHWRRLLGGPSLIPTELGEVLRALSGPRLRASTEPAVYAGLKALHAPVIEIRAPRESLLPFDLLPLGRQDGLATPADASGVMRLAELLPAFSAVVKYVVYNGVDETASRPPASPTGYAGEDSRPAARTSVRGLMPQWTRPAAGGLAFMRSVDTNEWGNVRTFLRSPHLNRLVSTMPEDGFGDDPLSLAMTVVTGDPSMNGGPRDSAARDVYVHAHGTLRASGAGRVQIRFRYPAGGVLASLPLRERIKVGLRERLLESWHLEAAMQEVERDQERPRGPTVWMNSCYVGDAVGNALVSDLLSVAQASGGAVIGPRDEVPEALAARLAKYFYEYQSVFQEPGRALLAARLATLLEFGNPLGLLYVGFGSVTQ